MGDNRINVVTSVIATQLQLNCQSKIDELGSLNEMTHLIPFFLPFSLLALFSCSLGRQWHVCISTTYRLLHVSTRYTKQKDIETVLRIWGQKHFFSN